MAAVKPEVLISPLLDHISTPFQRLTPIVGVHRLSGTIMNTTRRSPGHPPLGPGTKINKIILGYGGVRMGDPGLQHSTHDTFGCFKLFENNISVICVK